MPENRESALYLYLDQTPAVSMVYLNGCLVGRVRCILRRGSVVSGCPMACCGVEAAMSFCLLNGRVEPIRESASPDSVGPCVGVADRR